MKRKHETLDADSDTDMLETTSQKSCSNCGGTDFATAEGDDAECCTNCGVVSSGPLLVASFEPARATFGVKKNRQNDQKITRVHDFWTRLAVFYSFTTEQTEYGIALLDKYKPKLTQSHYQEVCVGLGCYLGMNSHPEWCYDDFINLYPAPLLRHVIIRSAHIFEENEKDTKWSGYNEKRVDQIIALIYKDVVSQLFGKKSLPSKFNISSLSKMAKNLIVLGSSQGVNSGKRAETVIVVATCIAATYLDSIIKKKSNIKTKWNWKKFEVLVNGTYHRSFPSTQKEYQAMLIACYKKIPFLPKQQSLDVIYLYLQDIFDLYLPQNNQPPSMSLEMRDFVPFSYVKSRKHTLSVHEAVNQANDCIINGILLTDLNTLVYDSYLALRAGHTKDEIETWSRARLMAEGQTQRFKQSFTDTRTNTNLDRPLVGQDDMGQDELAYYVS